MQSVDTDALVQVIGGLQSASATARAMRSERQQGRADGLDVAVSRLRALLGLDDHQVIVWMWGADGLGRYEIRGTGLV
jgi:hypothetical protein